MTRSAVVLACLFAGPALLGVACGPPAVGPQGLSSTANSASRTATNSPSASVEVPPEPVATLPRREMARRLAEAYRLSAEGKSSEARAAFADIVKLLKTGGHSAHSGLGDVAGEVVMGRTKAAFSTPNDGTWLFDPTSGEPIAYHPNLTLRRGAPALDGGLFARADAGGLAGLFDPRAGEDIELAGALIALHPQGHQAYLLDDDCRVREWSLEKRGALRYLAAPFKAPKMPEDGVVRGCERWSYRDAAVTADGKWLTTRVGRWNLTNGVYKPLPLKDNRAEIVPAVSPDGRYAAEVIADPKRQKDGVGAMRLVLHDLNKGTATTAPEPLPALSNGDPLSFGGPPLRVCVFDYGFFAFEVPSLRPIAPKKDDKDGGHGPSSFGPGCEEGFPPRPPDHPESRDKLASKVCELQGFLLPLSECP